MRINTKILKGLKQSKSDEKGILAKTMVYLAGLIVADVNM